MSIFGEKGYNINGIDLTPRTKELEEILKSKGYSVGNIEHADFFITRIRKFDVVCSFGFVEHFEDFSNVIERHLDLVNDGGYVLIAAPNFRGLFQCLYHKIFDNLNFKRHNIKSMRPTLWAKLIQKRGFEIISHGYIGNEVWRDSSTRFNIFLRVTEKFLIKLLKLTSELKPNNSLSSGYCIVLAKKKTINN
jgi:2-polyprenyl-3-methyl-5-hydroxy-6-metoxy-1,4-benzoquinol methylase